MSNPHNRRKFLAGDMSFSNSGKRDRSDNNGLNKAQQDQQRALKRKQELIRLVGAHMNTCQTCHVYGHNRCRALKELQDRHQ